MHNKTRSKLRRVVGGNQRNTTSVKKSIAESPVWHWIVCSEREIYQALEICSLDRVQVQMMQDLLERANKRTFEGVMDREKAGKIILQSVNI